MSGSSSSAGSARLSRSASVTAFRTTEDERILALVLERFDNIMPRPDDDPSFARRGRMNAGWYDNMISSMAANAQDMRQAALLLAAGLESLDDATEFEGVDEEDAVLDAPAGSMMARLLDKSTATSAIPAGDARCRASIEELAEMPEEWRLTETSAARLARMDPCTICKVPINEANYHLRDFTKKPGGNTCRLAHWCQTCRNERVRLQKMFLPTFRLHCKTIGTALSLNKMFGIDIFESPSQIWNTFRAEMKDSPAFMFVITYHVWLLALEAGEGGINGRQAFMTGVSPRHLAEFKRDLHTYSFRCARTGTSLNFIAGNGGSRPSLDKEVFCESTGDSVQAPPYFSKHQHLAITSLAWNFYGNDYPPVERSVGLLTSVEKSDKVAKEKLWKSRPLFLTRLKGLGKITIGNQAKLEQVLAALQLSPCTWKDWQVARKKASSVLAGQIKRMIKGRRYSKEPSTVVQLALCLLHGSVDAITGAPLDIEDRSIDALVCEAGHHIDNVIIVSRFVNYWKSSYYPYYSESSLEEWLGRSRESSFSYRPGMSLDQQIMALLTLEWRNFALNALDTAARQYDDWPLKPMEVWDLVEQKYMPE